MPPYIWKQGSKRIPMHKQIDFTQTYKKLRQVFVVYNEKLKEQQPEKFRKLSLKSTHMETVRELIRCYAAHLNKRGQLRLEGEKTFTVTHTGVGKNKLQHQTTIYRHILVLREAGIILNKVFHGSKRPVEIELNQELLVYKKGIAQTVTEMDAEIARLEAISKAKNTTCTDKDSCKPLDTDNKNRGCGYVEKAKGQETLGRKQGNNEAGTSVADTSPLESGQKQCTRVAGDDPQFSEIIDHYTMEAWRFARSVLYSRQELSKRQEVQAIGYVREYFALVRHDLFRRGFVDKLFNDFCERVIIAKKFVDKSPERFIPMPNIWFNRHFRQGFCGTLAWLNNVRSQREKLKGYIKKLTRFCTIYIQYTKDSSVHTYYESLKELDKLGDPKLTEYFNACVVDRNKFSGAYLNGYYREVSNG